MRAIMLAIALGVLTFQAPPKVSDPLWNVVFKFKDSDTEPTCRIHISVNAKTEGEAAIRANKYLSEKLSIAACEKLEFVEAQPRK